MARGDWLRQRLMSADGQDVCRTSLSGAVVENCAAKIFARMDGNLGLLPAEDGDDDTKWHARQLLSTWFRDEGEAAATERRNTTGLFWPESSGQIRRQCSNSRLPPREPTSSNTDNTSSYPSYPTGTPTGGVATLTCAVASALRRPPASPALALEGRPVSAQRRPRSADVHGAVESRLLALHSAAAAAALAGGDHESDSLREDVEVALSLLEERRKNGPEDPTSGRDAGGAVSSFSLPVSRRFEPETRTAGIDPLQRMEARQDSIRAQRQARQRAQSADGGASGASCVSGGGRGSCRRRYQEESSFEVAAAPTPRTNRSHGNHRAPGTSSENVYSDPLVCVGLGRIGSRSDIAAGDRIPPGSDRVLSSSALKRNEEQSRCAERRGQVHSRDAARGRTSSARNTRSISGDGGGRIGSVRSASAIGGRVGPSRGVGDGYCLGEDGVEGRKGHRTGREVIASKRCGYGASLTVEGSGVIPNESGSLAFPSQILAQQPQQPHKLSVQVAGTGSAAACLGPKATPQRLAPAQPLVPPAMPSPMASGGNLLAAVPVSASMAVASPPRDVERLAAARVEAEAVAAEEDARTLRIREEIEREAKAYRDLLTAERTRERKLTSANAAEEQLRRLQQQRSAANADRRKAAAGRLAFALEAVNRRIQTCAKRAVIMHLSEARSALLARIRMATALIHSNVLAACTRTWRSVATSERAEREAAAHLERRREEQRHVAAAAAFCEGRRARRGWFAWRLGTRLIREERAAEQLRERARQFADATSVAARRAKSKTPTNPVEVEASIAIDETKQIDGTLPADHLGGSITGADTSAGIASAPTVFVDNAAFAGQQVAAVAARANADARGTAEPGLSPKGSHCEGIVGCGGHGGGCSGLSTMTARRNSTTNAMGTSQRDVRPKAQARNYEGKGLPQPVHRSRSLSQPRLAYTRAANNVGGAVQEVSDVAIVTAASSASAPPSQPRRERAASCGIQGGAAPQPRQRATVQAFTPVHRAKIVCGAAPDGTGSAREASAPVMAALAAASPSGASAPAAAARRTTEARRPKVVVDMEKRAEERRRIAGERRDRQKQREEERLAAQREGEEEKRRLEEEEHRQRLRQKQEAERAEKLREARRKVDLALWREKGRQAREFWRLHRLVDAWCSLRQAALEAQERHLLAWRRYRRSLLHGVFDGWRLRQRWSVASEDASRVARACLASRCGQEQVLRDAWRWMLCCLGAAVELARAEAALARRSVERGVVRRIALAWRGTSADLIAARQRSALRHYASWLVRRALRCWSAGAERSRRDADLAMHRLALQEKVSGWLREMGGGI